MFTTTTLADVEATLKGENFAHIEVAVCNGNVYTFHRYNTFEELRQTYADDTICAYLWADDDNIVYISIVKGE